jgi:outer membrane protein TolC
MAAVAALGIGAGGQPPRGEDRLPSPRPAGKVPDPPPLSPSILEESVKPIDLGSALQLAGVQNPEIMRARERVTEAVALRQLAAAQILPTINFGTNVDAHQGVLQQSTGNILKVNRDSLYLGLGANAVAAGTVNIPGLVLAGNTAEVLYGNLVARQVVRVREFESIALRNDVLLRVASAYLNLLQAEGRRAIALQTRNQSREVARVTALYIDPQAKLGRKADADRAATDLDQRNADVLEAENAVLLASARLTELLGLDPSVRLHAVDGWVVPAPIVPDPIPLSELLAIALTQRPELAARQAAIQAALLRLREARLLPFSPNVILGFSAGTFGGGSNLASRGLPQANGTILQQPRFDSFDARQDVDATVFWSLRNLGLGNLALARVARSDYRITNFEFLEVLNRVRAEVAAAYARTHARYAQIETAERAVRRSQEGFVEDLRATRNRVGLPIEVLDSLRLLDRSRNAYLDAILEYNRAQFELYVALGQPPANVLARPIPASLVPAPPPPPP